MSSEWILSDSEFDCTIGVLRESLQLAWDFKTASLDSLTKRFVDEHMGVFIHWTGLEWSGLDWSGLEWTGVYNRSLRHIGDVISGHAHAILITSDSTAFPYLLTFANNEHITRYSRCESLVIHVPNACLDLSLPSEASKQGAWVNSSPAVGIPMVRLGCGH